MDEEAISCLKRKLQNCFSDKTVVIIGSGLSCAEGMPGMAQLSKSLCDRIPHMIKGDALHLWKEKFATPLQNGSDLESALLNIIITPQLENAIIQLENAIIKVTSEVMLPSEQKILEECIFNQRKLKISNLFTYLSPEEPQIIHIVTTNYDRLIEFAAESAGYGVDTMMSGRYWGLHAPKESKYSLCRGINEKANKLILKKMICIYKPHGSLDWYDTPAGVISSPFSFNLPRKIITPGAGKYVKGYYSPFDHHISKGNEKIDDANSLIIIGYGFNDVHLQTHITEKLKQGTKGIIITRTLSNNAENIINESQNVTALSRKNGQETPGTLITNKSSTDFIPDVDWWDIENFVKGVF